MDNFFRENWGVFTHYLTKSTVSAAEWQARTARFDAEKLAAQLHAVGAKWLFFTLGQASGHFAAPNATFDAITGETPSKCSERDLVEALYDALAPYGIRLCVYMPSEAPHCPNFGWHRERLPDGSFKGERLTEFQTKWEAVITEWSLRWGNKVSAWWVDSCYTADAMYRSPEPPNFHSFAAAMRAGNPDAMLAFNPGIRIPVVSLTEEDDYTAGELATSLPTAFDRFPMGVSSPKGFTPVSELTDIQYHLLCSLGRDWGHLVKTTEPRFPDGMVPAYTEYILGMGGAMTWEVPVDDNGVICEPFIRQLSLINR